MNIKNEKLGSVYLEVDGLDKERFKEVTKGMEFAHEINYNHKYIENYYGELCFKWNNSKYAECNSRKITIDELEQLINPTPQPTHFAISPEDYAEFMKWKEEQKPKLKSIAVVGCLYSDYKATHISFNESLQRIKFSDLNLIKLSYGSGGLDVFSAKDKDDSFYVLFGHWNDGVTE